MDTTEVFSFIKDFGFPVVLSWGAELVFACTHGRQAGGPHGSDRGTELQHRRHAGGRCEKVKMARCR